MSRPRLSAARKAILAARAIGTLNDVIPRGRRPARLSAPVAWRRLSPEERAFVEPVLALHCKVGEQGRPAFHDPMERLEACLEAACQRGPWRGVRSAVAPRMSGDALHRCFRRWAARGMWMALLRQLAAVRGRFPALEYFVCRAFRRAWRMQGLHGVMLARETGFASALRAPPSCFPDPVLSANCHLGLIAPMLKGAAAWPAGVRESFGRVLRAVARWCGGVRRIRRAWEPA